MAFFRQMSAIKPKRIKIAIPQTTAPMNRMNINSEMKLLIEFVRFMSLLLMTVFGKQMPHQTTIPITAA